MLRRSLIGYVIISAVGLIANAAVAAPDISVQLIGPRIVAGGYGFTAYIKNNSATEPSGTVQFSVNVGALRKGFYVDKTYFGASNGNSGSIPGGICNVSQDGTGGSCSTNSLPPLASGGMAVEFSVSPKSSANPAVSGSSYVDIQLTATSAQDPVQSNNKISLRYGVNIAPPWADLQVQQKIIFPKPNNTLSNGAVNFYEVTVTNGGPSVATGVSTQFGFDAPHYFTGPLPGGCRTTYPGGDSVQDVTCETASIAPGASIKHMLPFSFEFPPSPASPATGTISLYSIVSSGSIDYLEQAAEDGFDPSANERYSNIAVRYEYVTPEGDVPLPLWALGLLSSSLFLLIGNRRRRSI